MKRILVTVLAIAYFGVCSSPARGCFCILPEVSDSFTEARSVFLGETIQIVEPRTLEQEAPFAKRAFTIKFKIIQSWKGVPSGLSEFSILWLTNCYECLELPRMNERYLVFANPSPDSNTWGLVSMCNRTVGVHKDSNLTNPEADPERDMRELDVIKRRVSDRRRV